MTADTAPKTPDSAEASELVREMNAAYWHKDLLCKSQLVSMQAAARVLLERMREFRKSSDGTPATSVDINDFAREHGLSAPEDEDET